MLNRQSQFSSLWLPNLRRLYLVAYASRRFDLPPSKTSRPKYLFAKKILVLSLISSEILRLTFLIVLTWNLHFFGQSWVLSKMTLPIINSIPNAIICDIETIYVQFSETNLQNPIWFKTKWEFYFWNLLKLIPIMLLFLNRIQTKVK